MRSLEAATGLRLAALLHSVGAFSSVPEQKDGLYDRPPLLESKIPHKLLSLNISVASVFNIAPVWPYFNITLTKKWKRWNSSRWWITYMFSLCTATAGGREHKAVAFWTEGNQSKHLWYALLSCQTFSNCLIIQQNGPLTRASCIAHMGDVCLQGFLRESLYASQLAGSQAR